MSRIKYVVGALILAAPLFFVLVAAAHESWINQGAYRNKDGEWCCGDGDCHMLPKEQVHMTGTGYLILRNPLAGAGPVQQEHVPFSEALVSRDGEFWRCHRPDGVRRCFFAPPPSY
jgi:hypothetical protein